MIGVVAEYLGVNDFCKRFECVNLSRRRLVYHVSVYSVERVVLDGCDAAPSRSSCYSGEIAPEVSFTHGTWKHNDVRVKGYDSF